MMADVTSGDVKVPGLGEVPKKRILIIGVIAAVIVAGVLIVRGRSASSAAATTTASTDTSGDNSGDLDAAGYVIGSPEDIAWQDEQESGIDNGEDIGSAGDYPDSTNLDPEGYPIGSAQDLAYQQQQTTGIETNEEWVQACLNDLPGDQSTIQMALIAVLAGQTVTTAQKNLFLEGVALNQAPPQGYPTPIKTSDTAAQPGGGTGTTTTTTTAAKIKVPNVVGQPADTAIANLEKAGLKGSITLTAASNHPGIWHIVTKTQPAVGSSVAKGSTVVLYYRDSKTS